MLLIIELVVSPYDRKEGICYMHHPTERITHTTAFVTLGRVALAGMRIAQWVHHKGLIR